MLMIKTHGLEQTSAHFSRLGPTECDRIHQASLEILERVGIEVHDERARQLLVKGGGKADGIRIRLPEYRVRWALELAPNGITLCDRDGNVALRARQHHSYFGGGSDCLNILDHRTGERRRPVLTDVVEGVILQDALPEIDFVMSLVLPEDVDQNIYDRYQMEVMLNHTTKPIVFVTPDFEGCVAAVEMCEVVAGGAESFQRNPFATCYINVTSGLIANAEALQKCMYLAGKGLPLLWIPLNAGGVNSPVTTAGCMASMNAGTLLGIVLAQLVNEGTPVAVPGWNGGPYNLRTMVGNYVLADEQGVAIAMGRHYDLPVFGLSGSTDSKLLDHQAGVEAALSLTFALLSGGNINHDLGFMESGLQYSFQLLAMCNEHLGFLRAATNGVPVSDDDLALDVVEELGADGDYLTHDHTLRHYKRPFHSRLYDKRPYSQWLGSGGLSMEQRAAAWVDELLESHQPPTLPPDTQRDLKKIVAREQERSGQSRK
jgi:trimethylamine--corrinoid protein Co-methyltransferase